MRLFFCCASFLFGLGFALPTFAQATAPAVSAVGVILAPKPGDGSAPLPTASLFSVDTADSSLGITYTNRLSTRRSFVGASLKAKATNGIASFFRTMEMRPGARLDLLAGIHSLRTSPPPAPTPNTPIPPRPDSADFDWLAVKVGIDATKLVLVHRGEPFESQIREFTFTGGSGAVSYNFLSNGSTLWSVSVGVEKVNNAASLEEVDIEDTTEATSGATLRTITRTRSGRDATRYVQGLSVPVRVDWLFIPGDGANRVALTAFVRKAFHGAKTTQFTNVGGGFLIVKKDAPMIPLGGVVVELRDLGNVQGKNLSGRQRLVVSLQVQVPFSF